MITKLTNSCTKFANDDIIYYFLASNTIIVKNDKITIQSNSQRDLLERLTVPERKLYDLVYADIADKMGTTTAEQLVEVWVASGYFNVASTTVWNEVIGNSKELVYYTGIEAGNPSGNTNNVKTIIYKSLAVVVFNQDITYNSADNVLTITTYV